MTELLWGFSRKGEKIRKKIKLILLPPQNKENVTTQDAALFYAKIIMLLSERN